ncbi:unnamed protein product [Chondrus crispus]|uniref:EF-hand domain-containing protein n=1 Tax=Chondrus crispus TaxID=2769 RepID=R7Q693_CHOCR|nr:unnamed protein product [Chondrus crispus]CDF34052.1 unnamed protein product [Chondrus crispus]|eukprot:XP_005713871.1 unnamed protein product [Chondrus crispus]
MLKDIKAVKAIDKDTKNAVKDDNFLSLQAVTHYCCERGTLTDRAIHTIFNRYVSRTRVPVNGCTDDASVVGMSKLDFVRMFLALVGSATDKGLKYWFSVLDQDGDGWVGVADVAYFYAERKSESEKKNGILLTDVRSLWVRLCAMTGVSPKGRGISFRSMKELGKADREFVACALLIRRADDGNLTNVAATMEVQDKAGKAP